MASTSTSTSTCRRIAGRDGQHDARRGAGASSGVRRRTAITAVFAGRDVEVEVEVEAIGGRRLKVGHPKARTTDCAQNEKCGIAVGRRSAIRSRHSGTVGGGWSMTSTPVSGGCSPPNCHGVPVRMSDEQAALTTMRANQRAKECRFMLGSVVRGADERAVCQMRVGRSIAAGPLWISELRSPMASASASTSTGRRRAETEFVVGAHAPVARKSPAKMTTSCRKWISQAQKMPRVSTTDLARNHPRNPASNTPGRPPGVPK